MAQEKAELPVILRAYDLAKWGCERLANFPRSYRFTLGEALEKRLYLVLDLLVRARYDSRHRVALLADANVELELLRFQFRLAKDLKCLSLDSYGFAARTVNEVGVMVGGWLRKPGGAAQPEQP
jgi:hypothetical protein